MGTSLRRAVTQSAKDESVRVIVVTGAAAVSARAPTWNG
jgi:enoyl-CoA hydratase/carnithine racemase